MAPRGRQEQDEGVLPRIKNRRHLLAALTEAVFAKDLHHISHAINSVGVIRDPLERELFSDLAGKLSRLIERILRDHGE